MSGFGSAFSEAHNWTCYHGMFARSLCIWNFSICQSPEASSSTSPNVVNPKMPWLPYSAPNAASPFDVWHRICFSGTYACVCSTANFTMICQPSLTTLFEPCQNEEWDSMASTPNVQPTQPSFLETSNIPWLSGPAPPSTCPSEVYHQICYAEPWYMMEG